MLSSDAATFLATFAVFVPLRTTSLTCAFGGAVAVVVVDGVVVVEPVDVVLPVVGVIFAATVVSSPPPPPRTPVRNRPATTMTTIAPTIAIVAPSAEELRFSGSAGGVVAARTELAERSGTAGSLPVSSSVTAGWKAVGCSVDGVVDGDAWPAVAPAAPAPARAAAAPAAGTPGLAG